MKTIEAGTQVRYYQPGIDEILGSWSGRKTKVYGDSGSVKTVTVTEVRESGGVRYYSTDDDVVLTDSDIREVL